METFELKPYNFDKSFASNFNDGQDKHIIIRLSPKDNKINVMYPDKFSLCMSSFSKLQGIDRLRYLIFDYDTIFGVRYNTFKKYSSFFDCQERVLFEALIINFKRNHFKPFKWEKTKIGYELGIRRRKIESIITRFKSLGIIKYTTIKSKWDASKQQNRNSSYFDIDCKRILKLLPTVFSEFDYDKTEHDILKYLEPSKSQNNKD